MFSANDGFPFIYKHNKAEKDGATSFIRHTYTFKSPKSNQTYIVEVDEFSDFLLYVVKFYLKNHRLSKNKFKLQTGLNEASRGIGTCVNIMVELYQKNPFRSFAFIGAASESENKNNTKRFRLYKKVMEAVFTPTTFDHFQHPKSSAYMMLNRAYSQNHLDLRNQIEDFFLKNYDLILEDQ